MFRTQPILGFLTTARNRLIRGEDILAAMENGQHIPRDHLARSPGESIAESEPEDSLYAPKSPVQTLL